MPSTGFRFSSIFLSFSTLWPPVLFVHLRQRLFQTPLLKMRPNWFSVNRPRVARRTRDSLPACVRWNHLLQQLVSDSWFSASGWRETRIASVNWEQNGCVGMIREFKLKFTPTAFLWKPLVFLFLWLQLCLAVLKHSTFTFTFFINRNTAKVSALITIYMDWYQIITEPLTAWTAHAF